MVVDEESGAKIELVDEDGDARVDTEEDSDATANATDGATAAARAAPAFSSIGSPTIPTPKSLQVGAGGSSEDVANASK